MYWISDLNKTTDNYGKFVFLLIKPATFMGVQVYDFLAGFHTLAGDLTILSLTCLPFPALTKEFLKIYGKSPSRLQKKMSEQMRQVRFAYYILRALTSLMACMYWHLLCQVCIK